MSDASQKPPVSLEDYAFVSAGTSDGIDLDALLAHRELDPSSWPWAEMYWLEQLMNDLIDNGGKLSLRLGELQAEARKNWDRRLPPLDEDLRAWVDWSRQLSRQSDPAAWLEEQGLRPLDLLKLQQIWTERLTADEAMREEHAAMLEEPAEPVEVPKPEAPKLPEKETSNGGEDIGGTGFGRALTDEELGGSLPFEAKASAEADGYRATPDLLAPVPKPPAQEGGVDSTAHFDLGALGTSLPFFDKEPPAAGVVTPSAPAPVPSHQPPAKPVAVPPAPAPPPPPAPAPLPEAVVAAAASPVVVSTPGSMDHTAVGGVPALDDDVLPFQGKADAPPVAPLAAHPNTGATAFVSAIDIADLPAGSSSSGDVDMTMPPSERPSGPSLPFSGEAEAPPPSTTADAASSNVGGTAFVSLSEMDFEAATPFDSASENVDTTAPGGVPLVGEAVPFAGDNPAPPPASAHPHRPTGTKVTSEPHGDAPLPFVAAKASDPPLVPGGLTLAQLAALTVEMEFSYARTKDLLATYGLTPESFRAHNDARRALFASDPAAEPRWEQAKTTYRQWRSAQPR